VTRKTLPEYLGAIWTNAGAALVESRIWLIVGYSLPEYDELVRDLFTNSVRSDTVVHVFDPDDRVANRFRSVLPNHPVHAHAGLPEGIADIEEIVEESARTFTPAE
jgi:hypothetical protein